jgi:hypothetical protein
MAIRAKFVRLARYSHKFGEASHIFLENGLWRVSASLASTCNTAWQMSASLASQNINTKSAADASASTRDICKIRTRKICARVAIACEIDLMTEESLTLHLKLKLWHKETVKTRNLRNTKPRDRI